MANDEAKKRIVDVLRAAGCSWVRVEERLAIDWGAPTKVDRGEIYDAELVLLNELPDDGPTLSFSGHRDKP